MISVSRLLDKSIEYCEQTRRIDNSKYILLKYSACFSEWEVVLESRKGKSMADIEEMINYHVKHKKANPSFFMAVQVPEF